MLKGLTKPLRHCTLSELSRHSDSRVVRASQSRRQYSIGLLEEAFKLSNTIGVTEAAKVSGVNISSLRHYRFLRRCEDGHKPKSRPAKNSIPISKKLECYKTAMMLHRRKFAKGLRPCWIEAGKMVGVNGRSVEFQYVRGFFKP